MTPKRAKPVKRDPILEQGPRVRAWVATGAVVGVPVWFLRLGADPFLFPKFTLLAVATAVLIAIRSVEIGRGARMHPPPFMLPAALFVGGLLLSWLLSDYRSWSTMGAYARLHGLLPYVVVVLFGVMTWDSYQGRARDLARYFVWAGAIVGGYAVIQALGLDPFTWNTLGGQATGLSTTGNPNFTGGFLGMVLPVGLGLVLTDRERRKEMLRLLMVVAGGWIVARSQGGWAAGVAGCAVVAGFYFRERFRLARIAGIAVAGAVASGTAGIVLVNIVMPGGRFAVASFSARGEWWTAAGRMFVASPIFGTGPDSFAIEGVHYRTVADALRFGFDFPTDPHSVPLALLANVGLIGACGFLALIAWGLLTAWRNSSNPLAICLSGGLVAYTVQSLVSIDELSLRSGFWILIAGIGAAAGSDVRERARAARTTGISVRRAAGTIVGAVVLITALAGSGILLTADARFRDGLDLFGRDPVAAANQISKAYGLYDHVEYRGRLGVILSRRLIQDPDQPDAEVLLREARSAFSFVDEVPYVFSLVSYATLLHRWSVAHSGAGDPEAQSLFELALEIDPLNPSIRSAAAESLVDLGRPEEAIELLEPRLDEVDVSAHPDYWGTYALAAAEVGDTAAAEDALEMLAQAGVGSRLLERAQTALESK